MSVHVMLTCTAQMVRSPSKALQYYSNNATLLFALSQNASALKRKVVASSTVVIALCS
jgi:hypothetical protein